MDQSRLWINPEIAKKSALAAIVGVLVVVAVASGIHFGLTNSTSQSTSVSSAPPWMSVTLNNPRTGESFKVSDFRGKVVLLEIMAVWCTVCAAQGTEMKKALNTLSPDVKSKVVFISVDVDPNENAQTLAKYAERLYRTWPFVYDSTGDFFRSFVRSSIQLEVTSSPLYIIDPCGGVTRIPGEDVKPASVIISCDNLVHQQRLETEPKMSLVEFATAFSLGIAASSNPCVIPLYPGFIAYLGKAGRFTGRTSEYLLGLFVLLGVTTSMLAIGGLITIARSQHLVSCSTYPRG